MLEQIKQNKCKKKKGFSLRTKWTFWTSLFLLIMFALFSIFLYRNATNLMFQEGRKKVNQTMSDIQVLLARSDHSLTEQSTASLLSRAIQLPRNLSDVKSGKDKVEVDALVSNLAANETNVYIFNQKKQLIFNTQPHHHNYSDKRQLEQSLHIGERDGVSGFIVSQAVRSNKTKEIIGYVQIFYELTPMYDIQKSLARNLFLFFSIWLILTIVCAMATSHFFLKPLRSIMKTIEDIKKDPMTERRVAVPKSHDEFRELILLFNGMLDQMQSYMDQQKQFVEDVSHELRTPVAIIEGHLKMLDRWGKDDPEVLEESITASLQEISRMKSLVQEMLDLTRVEQAEIIHHNETSPARDIVTQVVNNFQMIYPDFKFLLDDDLRSEKEVAIFRDHFEQLLIIIIDNAVKYSTNKKVVHISLSSNPHEIEIAIQDFGEGISQKDLKKVFNRFYRVDKARSRHKGGNGLGLSIAQKLVETYHGHLSVESVLGQGTIFHIEIPLVEAETAKAF